jgi:hypothetical protein
MLNSELQMQNTVHTSNAQKLFTVGIRFKSGLGSRLSTDSARCSNYPCYCYSQHKRTFEVKQDPRNCNALLVCVILLFTVVSC